MSLLKYLERLKRMDDLIYRKATGSSEEFAQKIGISVSVLKDNLSEMRKLGASISFCRTRKSYFYSSECRLLFRFEKERLNQDDFSKIKGGSDFIEFFIPSDYTGR